jgi:alanine racemase
MPLFLFYTYQMTQPISVFDALPRDCWLNINTAQLTENARRLQAHIGKPLLVAVKGNGYGHGYELAARAFLAAGVRYLGVANLAEGVILRGVGITTPVLILGGMLPHDMAPAAAAGLEFMVFRPDHVVALREIPKGSSAVRIHIKVDTGMGRIGCFPEEAAALAESIKAIPGVQIAGISTHFARASLPGNPHTESQIDKFEQAIAALAAIGIRPEIIHAANSSGSLYHPRARYDMVRLGIVSYGVRPSAAEGTTIPDGVATALTWHARVTSSKILPKDSKISYGCEYSLIKDTRIGILPVGYVDGFRRSPRDINTVLIDGQERSVRGRVNMDQSMIDLDGFPDMTGQEVVLLGKQGDKEISVYDLAKRWEDNTYNVYSAIAMRVPRRPV